MFTTWGEYIDESVIDEFEAETGIHVTYDLFETNEEMYPVIEAGAVSYDAVCPSDYMIQKMVENGLLAEINFENVPNIANIDPVYLEKSKAFDPENRYSVPYTWGTVGIIYNVQKLEELGVPAPTKWSDLWDRKIKGRDPDAGQRPRRVYGCIKGTWIFHEHHRRGRAGGGEEASPGAEAVSTGICCGPGPR